MYPREKKTTGPADGQPHQDDRGQIPVRWSPARPSASASKRNQYDKLPSDDIRTSQTLPAPSTPRNQYDELPSTADMQTFQSQRTMNAGRNQYDKLPSVDVEPPRARSPHSPYGTPIFVEDGSTQRRVPNAPVRPTGAPNSGPADIAEARKRYGKIPLGGPPGQQQRPRLFARCAATRHRGSRAPDR